tara:strand:- start:413 stop:1255 length:843 start_codon:yes stop_codon:yes gene_type:complete
MYIDENSKPKEKLKAWYLFTDDFIAGTQHLTNQQIGIYIRLLCWNWNKRCCGIPNDKDIYYRIGNCITDQERVSCETIIKEFFVEVQGIYQNERQLQEFLYITKRIEASKENGKLGGRPKKPRLNPPTSTPTPTITATSSYKQENLFDTFWEKIKNKVGKGTAFKNYLKLEKEWYFKAIDLAMMYNKYYDSLEDKKFAKYPAFWLSDKRYLDEPVKNEDNKVDPYVFHLDLFLTTVKSQTVKPHISRIAQKNIDHVKRAINENKITKDDAIKYLDMAMWL